jgi:hypothetical protein
MSANSEDPVRVGCGWCVGLAGLALVAAAIGGPLAYYHTETFKAAAKSGLTQEVDRGNTIWVKPKN